MYYEATIKFKINIQDEEIAKDIAQNVIEYMNNELKDSAIRFAENIELLSIEDVEDR